MTSIDQIAEQFKTYLRSRISYLEEYGEAEDLDEAATLSQWLYELNSGKKLAEVVDGRKTEMLNLLVQNKVHLGKTSDSDEEWAEYSLLEGLIPVLRAL